MGGGEEGVGGGQARGVEGGVQGEWGGVDHVVTQYRSGGRGGGVQALGGGDNAGGEGGRGRGGGEEAGTLEHGSKHKRVCLEPVQVKATGEGGAGRLGEGAVWTHIK